MTRFVLSLLLGSLLPGAGLAPAQETGNQKAAKAEGEVTAEEEDEEDWMVFYYQNPKPDRLVSEVKQWAEEGVLENESASPAVIAFLSQVFRQNPDRIADWHRQLSGLDEAEMKIIRTALLFSRTTEADEILRQRFGADFDKQKQVLPKILELDLAKRHTFDMLWGFFYATGSENAVRRIVAGYQFEEAPAKPKGAKVPKNFQPLYRIVPDAVDWMLTSHATHHPRVTEICEKLYADETACTAVERKRLRQALAKMKPEKYPIEPAPEP